MWQLKVGEIYDRGKMTYNSYVLDLDLVKFSHFDLIWIQVNQINTYFWS